MRGIELADSIVEDILSSSIWGDKVKAKVEDKKDPKPSEKITEGKKEKEEVVEEEVEEIVEHTCPLCDSKLTEAISDEKLYEHVSYIMGVINEAFNTEGGEDVEAETTENETVED